CSGPNGIELGERVAPDVIEAHRARDGPTERPGHRDVVERGPHIGLEQLRVTRMGQDLIHPSARHHIAAQEQRAVGWGWRRLVHSFIRLSLSRRTAMMNPSAWLALDR